MMVDVFGISHLELVPWVVEVEERRNVRLLLAVVGLLSMRPKVEVVGDRDYRGSNDKSSRLSISGEAVRWLFVVADGACERANGSSDCTRWGWCLWLLWREAQAA